MLKFKSILFLYNLCVSETKQRSIRSKVLRYCSPQGYLGQVKMEYTIREAEERDAEEIEKLAMRCPPLRGSISGTYEYLALCFRRYFLIAEAGGEIIAFLVGFPNLDVEGEIWIYQIAVCEEERGTSLARELLTEEMKRFASDGYNVVKARILEDNNCSLGLFKKLGFERVCIVDGWVEVVRGIKDEEEHRGD
ncbi:MAG: GNAT family N-acetyltransferase [Halobacteriota archaeon]|nr:GNAT family N-acetyltransferase [Halobacteriota archaeon]